MRVIQRNWLLALAAMACLLPGLSLANDDDAHGVFVMTNNADDNEVIAYERDANGTLEIARRYKTEGRGSGGTLDPLSSQGSLTLSEDHAWLFAANAGSGSISVFRVRGSRLELSDVVPTEGSEPNAVAQHGDLVYVLNTAGSSSVVGFRLDEGGLTRIDDSLRFLSGNGAGSSSLAFSPDGRFLLVTERTTNDIDVFKVLSDGTLSAITLNKSAGPGAFSVVFAPNGTAIVTETGSSAPNSSAMSSYHVQPDNTLKVVTASIPTLGAANCWNVVTPDGHFVYAANAGSSTIAGFAVGSGGALTPIQATIVGINPSGASNLDLAITSDGKFLYSLNAGNDTIGLFAINPKDGALTSLGTLPIDLEHSATGHGSNGLNGIAAN
ncbi:MAG: beta-propeller fold lactonase family protein [Sinobacteraceae bacterium]|nr:beta-propeller fold lactonase family protein [Nevskiaceae bacterium]